MSKKDRVTEALISWERWEVPNKSFSFNEEAGDDIFLSEDDNDEIDSNMMMLVDPKVFTPMGAYHADDPLSPHNLCEECWWLHTKFRCSDIHANAIRSIPGLELLVQVTKYRYFIGLGKMFTLKDVRQEVEEVLLSVEQQVLEEELAQTKLEDFVMLTETQQQEYFKQQIEEVKEMANNYKAWAISIDHTGEILSLMTNDPEDEEYKKACKEMKDINGFFITSENGSLSV